MWLAVSWVSSILVEAFYQGHLREEFAVLKRLLTGLHIPILVNIAAYVGTGANCIIARYHNVFGRLVVLAYASCQFCLLVLPPIALYYLKPDYSPVLGAAVTMQQCVFIMKSHSYVLHMLGYTVTKTKEKEPLPADVEKQKPLLSSIGAFYDYMLLPTLLYQPPFPRIPHRRWGQIVKNILLSFSSLFVLYTILNHSILPGNLGFSIFPNTVKLSLDLKSWASFVHGYTCRCHALCCSFSHSMVYCTAC